MPDPTYSHEEYMMVEAILGYLEKNMAIKFDITGDSMPENETNEDFNDRQALIRARELVLNAATRTL